MLRVTLAWVGQRKECVRSRSRLSLVPNQSKVTRLHVYCMVLTPSFLIRARPYVSTYTAYHCKDSGSSSQSCGVNDHGVGTTVAFTNAAYMN